MAEKQQSSGRRRSGGYTYPLERRFCTDHDWAYNWWTIKKDGSGEHSQLQVCRRCGSTRIEPAQSGKE